MQNYNSPARRPCAGAAAGFTLPAVLIITGALLILAIGALMVVGIERNTARSFVDKNRADLAVQAGLEDIRALFNTETSNDDFLIIESPRKDPLIAASAATVAPYLFITRGEKTGGSIKYRQIPLFSNVAKLPGLESPSLTEPLVDEAVIGPDAQTASFKTLPYLPDAKVAWLPVLDSNGKMISRYAYWVEDLQGKIDAATAGNVADGGTTHKRTGWKENDKSSNNRFPAPGINPEPSVIGKDGRDQNPPLDSIATYLLAPGAVAKDLRLKDPKDEINAPLIAGRKTLISPNSVLAAADVTRALTRTDGVKGSLTDQKSSALEENFTASVMPYEEQPRVPFSPSIAASAVDRPKLNLNALLAKSNGQAVEEMASWIGDSLPKFTTRKGGFPDDYLRTLAAGAIDYADQDPEATTSAKIMGKSSYRGLDAYPLISETALHINYKGISKEGTRVFLSFELRLFVELWNHTNREVSGFASFSYENRGKLSPFGPGTPIQFDDEMLVDDPLQVDLKDKSQELRMPFLLKGPDYYWFQPIIVNLQPNEYRFFKTPILKYKINVDLKDAKINEEFTISEALGVSGISMKWGDTIVERVDKLVRQGSSPTKFKTGRPAEVGKANIIGHSYGPYGEFKNNMGDVRQALYLREQDAPASDNKYPGNVSPNVRNIRNETIYKDGAGQALVYGRVLPSEWPDGGHDVAIKKPKPATVAAGFDPTNLEVYPRIVNSLEGEAPTFLSNRGRFYSATELGRIFDPIMYQPRYDNEADTAQILKGTIPGGQPSWPSMEFAPNLTISSEDKYYGGGNTLRIGRPEHPWLSRPKGHQPNLMPQDHAARLLDLFHTGKSRSDSPGERAGNTVRIEGHVNLNTASKDALRALAGGQLEMDPRLSKRVLDTHLASSFTARMRKVDYSAPTKQKEADVIAEAIIRGRPYASCSEIASALDDQGRVALGNKMLLPDAEKTNWSDAAAEEVFARIYNSSTVRSRNFRVWIVGQAVTPTEPANSTNPEVLSEVRRAYTIFADPGERKPNGEIEISKTKLNILHENDF